MKQETFLLNSCYRNHSVFTFNTIFSSLIFNYAFFILLGLNNCSILYMGLKIQMLQNANI